MKTRKTDPLLEYPPLKNLTRTLCLALFIGLLMIPVTAAAAVTMFLEIEGVEGGATDLRHRGDMDVVAFTEVAKTKKTPFRIVATKLVDKSSPTLRQMLNNADVAATAKLTIYTPGFKTGSVETVVIEMHNVSIQSVNSAGASDTEKLTEVVTLDFDSGLWSYTPSGADGSPGGTTSVGYNIIKNAKQ